MARSMCSLCDSIKGESIALFQLIETTSTQTVIRPFRCIESKYVGPSSGNGDFRAAVADAIGS